MSVTMDDLLAKLPAEHRERAIEEATIFGRRISTFGQTAPSRCWSKNG